MIEAGLVLAAAFTVVLVLAASAAFHGITLMPGALWYGGKVAVTGACPETQPCEVSANRLNIMSNK